jgi:Chromo (CHRromatin Organisation MOdifier) domain
MKKFADTNRTERSFVVGDWVYIRLQPYRQVSISNSRNHKLNLCFYGPFEIEERVGSSCVFRLVLHVSQLKIHIPRGQIVSLHLPITSPDGFLRIYPKSIMSCRAVKHDNVAVPQFFVSWTNLPPEDASWEDYDSIAM